MLASLSDTAKTLVLFVPISLIGLWRWSFWLVRRLSASFYRPPATTWPADKPKLTVSLVTPVYNEDPKLWDMAMESWIANGVNEIVAVIDKSNKRLIVDFERKYVPLTTVRCKLIVTPKPGKRAALCDGMTQASGDVIVLVDSDTVWGPNVLSKALPCFLDANIGGVTVGQRIQNPDNVSNVMFDILLWTRYKEEVPFMLVLGKAFNTLSGRTAFYRREALLNPEHDNIHNLRHEFFLNTRGISGDDKRLTHLILEQNWHVTYAQGAWVYTPGLNSIKKFLKQRLRWTRNSWRADLRAVKRGWVWRHPALALFMLDRFIQPFFMLFGPIVFTLALLEGEWLIAGTIVIWWFVSRCVRLFGYFRLYPKKLIYLPAYIIYGYVNAIIKLYALATLLEHSWATRWHSYRMKSKKIFKKFTTVGVGTLAVIVFITAISYALIQLRNDSGATISIPESFVENTHTSTISFVSDAPVLPKIPDNIILPTGVKMYVVQTGDTMNDLAVEFKTTTKELKKLNGLRDADIIQVGQTLLYLDRSTEVSQ